MEYPAARSLALYAVRCFRRQLPNRVLKSDVHLDRQLFLGGAPVESLVESKPKGSFTRSEQNNDEVLARDRSISPLDALIVPSRNSEPRHGGSGWNGSHGIAMDFRLQSGALPLFDKDSCREKFNEIMLNSAQRELKEQLALVRRNRSDLPRFVSGFAESSREAFSLATVVAESSVEACNTSFGEQAVRPKIGVSPLASVLSCVQGGLGLSVLQRNDIDFECSSVKRKRKKKMNKHKQRKLRRRDRHRNT